MSGPIRIISTEKVPDREHLLRRIVDEPLPSKFHARVRRAVFSRSGPGLGPIGGALRAIAFSVLGRSASCLAVCLVLLQTGCVTNGPPVSPEEQVEPIVPSVDPAYRAPKLLKPEQKAHCEASIKNAFNSGVEILEPMRFDPSAAEFVRSKIYHLFNPATYEDNDGYVALITRCSVTSIIGTKSAKYCGCFYEVHGDALKFVRVLTPTDFVKKRYY
jgi:hypothetical protein